MAHIKQIDLSTGNSISSYLIEPTLFGIATASNAGEIYTVTFPSTFELITGVCVQVKFPATNAANAQLNNKYIYYNNDKIAAGTLKAHHTYDLVYDGVQWQLIGDMGTDTTAWAAANHTHGHIQNDGTLQTEADITIATGDKLIVTDASDSNKIARASITFDGSTTTQALTKKGTWETFNNYSHPTSDGNKHVPETGTTNDGKFLKAGATAGNFAWATLTTTDISDFPTTMTPTSHTHGNITNDGKLQTNDVSIGANDQLVITDNSDGKKIARASITFDGTTKTQALTPAGTWETFNNYTHPTTSGNKHIPSGGSSGQFLGWGADGTAAWTNNPNTDTKVVQVGAQDNNEYPILMKYTTNYSDESANSVKFGAKSGKEVTINPETGIITAAGFVGTIASASSVPLSGVEGADDLKLIEALSGHGLLRRTINDGWELDQNAYVTSSGVTSITINVSSPLSINETGEITSSGTRTIGFLPQAPHTVLIGPDTGTATQTGLPTFRALQIDDLPMITVAKGGTGISNYTAGDILYADDATTLATLHGNDTTTKKFLRSVAANGIVTAPVWDTLSDTDIPELSASKITSGAFNADRIPNLDASKITSGTLSSNVSLANHGINIAGTAVAIGSSIDSTTLRTNLGLSTALRFIGRTTTTMTDPFTGTPIIPNTTYTPVIGDVVIDNASDSEYVCISVSNDTYVWERLGPDSSWALANHAHGNITNAGAMAGSTVTGAVTNQHKFLREDGTWQIPAYTVNTDSKVEQITDTRTSGDYPLLYSYYTTNAADTSVAQSVYQINTIYANPQTGSIHATKFIGAFEGNLTGNISGTAANVTGTVAVAHGGTGVETVDEIFAAYGTEYIIGTQASATNAWAGITQSSSLYIGKTIAYKLPFNSSGDVSLTLTFTNPSGNIDSGAIPVYTNNTRVNSHYQANAVVLLVYDGTSWRATDYWNTDSRDAGYGKITPGTASISEAAITPNTTQITAETYNEAFTINPGNKWISLAGTESGVIGSDILTIAHSLSGVTAGTSSPNTAQTPGYGSTFNIPTVTVDAAGHVTALGTATVQIPASDNTDTATAADNILQGSNSGTQITYQPYSTRENKLMFYTGTTDPNGTTRLNLNGYLYATKLFSNDLEIYGDTDATNTNSGSIKTAGGVGIAKSLYVGTGAFISKSSEPQLTLANSNTTGGNVAINLLKAGTTVSASALAWQIIGIGDNLYLRNNYTTVLQDNFITNIIQVKKADSEIVFYGNLLPSSNNQDIGSSSYKWADLYCAHAHSNTLTVGSFIGTSQATYGTTLPASPEDGQIFFQISDPIYELPPHGNAGEALIKRSNSDRDVTWGAVGGIMNPIDTSLAANSSTSYYVTCSSSAVQNSDPAVFDTNVYIKNTVLFGAAWNDYAEYRQCNDIIAPGRCIIENGDGTLSLSTKRLQSGAEIVSDTFGFAIGQTEKCNTPIAVSGRVLAYPYEPIENIKIGAPVCSGPNGTISQMTEEEACQYPWMIIGTVSSIPQEKTWGAKNVSTKGRIWIRIR